MLRGLKERRLVPGDKVRIGIGDLELIAKDEQSFEGLLDGYPGIYDQISELVGISGSLKLYKRVTVMVWLLFSIISVVLINVVFFIWLAGQPPPALGS